MTEHDLDFEISFYENLIREKPDFVEALFALGEAYTKTGAYEKGFEIDKRLVALRPDDPIARYNLACDYSLLKKPDDCLSALEKAIQLGYQDFELMELDPDLSYIREDGRYKVLIAKYKMKRDL